MTLPYQHFLPVVLEDLLFYPGSSVSFSSTHGHAKISPILKELSIISSNHSTLSVSAKQLKKYHCPWSLHRLILTHLLHLWVNGTLKTQESCFHSFIYHIVLHYLLNLYGGESSSLATEWHLGKSLKTLLLPPKIVKSVMDSPSYRSPSQRRSGNI